MDPHRKSLLRLVLVSLLAAATLTGCATLPPAKSVSDIKNVVGKWEGFGWGPRNGEWSH